MHRQTFNVGDIVYVDNKMQKGYSYPLVAERGAPTANFDPVFTPNAMLRLGFEMRRLRGER